MRMREDANLRVGEHEPAHQIVLQITLNRDSQRFLRQTAPRLARNIIDIKPPPQIFFGNERLQHRIPDMLGKNARQIVKLFHLPVLFIVTRQLNHRLPAYGLIDVAQQQTAMMCVTHVWRKRRGRAPAQFEIESEIANDLFG